MNGVPNEVWIVLGCALMVFILIQGVKLTKHDGGNNNSNNSNNSDGK